MQQGQQIGIKEIANQTGVSISKRFPAKGGEHVEFTHGGKTFSVVAATDGTVARSDVKKAVRNAGIPQSAITL